ncbi:MAG: transposase family protein [Roseiarcus sp.]
MAPGPSVRVLSVERLGDRWVVAAVGQRSGSCPGCGEGSTLRHSWRILHLQDLSIQGAIVTLQLRVSRWRCHNSECPRKTFAEQMPDVFALSPVEPEGSPKFGFRLSQCLAYREKKSRRSDGRRERSCASASPCSPSPRRRAAGRGARSAKNAVMCWEDFPTRGWD